MNYYRCYIEVDGYGTCYSQDVSCIWAKDAEEAREIYRKENNFRKNKKGLTVELAEYTRDIANKQTVNQVLTKNVWNSFLQMTEEIKYWGKVIGLTVKEVGNRFDKAKIAQLVKNN